MVKLKKILTFIFPSIYITSVQYDEGHVGYTYIKFKSKQAMFYSDERGGWPGSIYTNASKADNNNINGICFAGGSLLGLEAITGITSEEMKKAKYQT